MWIRRSGVSMGRTPRWRSRSTQISSGLLRYRRGPRRVTPRPDRRSSRHLPLHGWVRRRRPQVQRGPRRRRPGSWVGTRRPGPGSFISQVDFGAFGDVEGGHRIARRLIRQGADIIFPVAGEAGLGAGEAAREAGGTLLIGVDFDQFFQAPPFADLWLTSVRKRYDIAVKNVVRHRRRLDLGGPPRLRGLRGQISSEENGTARSDSPFQTLIPQV